MKPIEEILKEVEEYEKLKAEACICLPSETLWSEASNKFVTFSLEWSPETIIRELVAVVGAQTEIIKAYERRDQKTKG